MREFFKIYFGYFCVMLELVGSALKWVVEVVFAITMAVCVFLVIYYLYYKFGILRLSAGVILTGIIGVPADLARRDMQEKRRQKKEDAKADSIV